MMDDVPCETRLARELAPDERLLWSGRPRRGLMLRAADGFGIPFSLLWCGFAVFWELSVVRSGAPWSFRLWGIPFVFVGLYLVVGRFVVDALQRRRTIYGLTSSRIVIVGASRHTVQSLLLRGLMDLSLVERADGSGTIVLGSGAAAGSFLLPGWPGRRVGGPLALEGITAARVVYDLIRQAQSASG